MSCVNINFPFATKNASYPGWLTEKILDAMFAGSVPVYQGDPEVTEMVPANAFIDKREFPNYDILYRYNERDVASRI